MKNSKNNNDFDYSFSSNFLNRSDMILVKFIVQGVKKLVQKIKKWDSNK